MKKSALIKRYLVALKEDKEASIFGMKLNVAGAVAGLSLLSTMIGYIINFVYTTCCSDFYGIPTNYFQYTQLPTIVLIILSAFAYLLLNIYVLQVKEIKKWENFIFLICLFIIDCSLYLPINNNVFLFLLVKDVFLLLALNMSNAKCFKRFFIVTISLVLIIILICAYSAISLKPQNQTKYQVITKLGGSKTRYIVVSEYQKFLVSMPICERKGTKYLRRGKFLVLNPDKYSFTYEDMQLSKKDDKLFIK